MRFSSQTVVFDNVSVPRPFLELFIKYCIKKPIMWFFDVLL